MSKKRHFSDETIESLRELGEHLLKIHNRLISEGYTIKDGVITPPPGREHQDDPPSGKRRGRPSAAAEKSSA